MGGEAKMAVAVPSADELRFIDPGTLLGDLAHRYLAAMLARNRNQARDLVMDVVEKGAELKDVYLQVFQPVQYEIGWLWQTGAISVGHEHYCTNSSQLIMSMLYGRLFSLPPGDRKLVAACVEGELHEFGIRMLADFFEMEGWDTHFLGANTPEESIVSSLDEVSADLLLVGVTMHDRVAQAQSLIERVRASTAASVPILVGGYTFRTVFDLWRKVGADGSAADAAEALKVGARLAGGGRNG